MFSSYILLVIKVNLPYGTLTIFLQCKNMMSLVKVNGIYNLNFVFLCLVNINLENIIYVVEIISGIYYNHEMRYFLSCFKQIRMPFIEGSCRLALKVEIGAVLAKLLPMLSAKNREINNSI